MIEIKKGDYYVGLWFVSYRGGDWMAVVKREKGEEAYSLIYRFRYRKDDKFFEESEDEKSWYEMRISGKDGGEVSGDELVQVGDDAAALVDAAQAPSDLYQYLIFGDGDAFLKALEGAPFIQAKTVGAAQA